MEHRTSEINKLYPATKDTEQEKKSEQEEETRRPGDITVGQYLIKRLRELGIDHVFGVPGDYSFSLLEHIVAPDSGLKYIGTCNELNAANAADAYAKVKRVPGVVAVTYGVGELSALNGVAGSYVEFTPVIVLVGAPASKAFSQQKAMHHTFPGDYFTPNKIFKNVTVAQAFIKDPRSAPRKIDRALQACISLLKPVYISIPSDVIYQGCSPPKTTIERINFNQDSKSIQEAVDEATTLIKNATKPLVLIDADVRRYKCEEYVLNFLSSTQFPFGSMPMGKSILSEQHPQFIGIYNGKTSQPYIKQLVQDSDCLIIFGLQMVDLNTGGFTTGFDHHPGMIKVFPDRLRIKDHWFFSSPMSSFIPSLTSALNSPSSFIPNSTCSLYLQSIQHASKNLLHTTSTPFIPKPNTPLTVSRLCDKLAHTLSQNSIVIIDTGILMFDVFQTLFPQSSLLVSQIFYGSIGYSLGATIGACAASASQNRPVTLLIGDGSFQVTAVDLSTLIRYGYKVRIILLNNDGYTIERGIFEGKYNDIGKWKYGQLVEAFGGEKGRGKKVEKEEELEEGLKEDGEGVVLVECVTEKMDMSEAAREGGKGMRETNGLKAERCNPNILNV